MLLMITPCLLLVKTKYRYHSYGPILPELNVYTKSANWRNVHDLDNCKSSLTVLQNCSHRFNRYDSCVKHHFW
jgi:hypothetical protein